jgi:hypothetical protein
MLNGNVFYHGILRKTIIGFGRLFSDIYIDRKKDDSVDGTTVQRLQIPLAYAPKEKWIVRLDSDPNLESHTYVSLPRMSFEITGYNYDSTRKTNRMSKITCVDSDGNNDNTTSFMYSPVPYNVDISLYILTKTQEDAMQIIEQILPTFTPEYTLKLNMIKEMNIIQDVPVILNSITVQDDYDGDFQTRRFVIHTLTFTLKTNLFGNINGNGIIGQVNVNVGADTGTTKINQRYVVEGDVTTRVVAQDGWTSEL